METLYPNLKVLYMSGYTDIAITQNGLLDEGAGFIQKSFTPEMLGHKMEEALNAA